MTARGRMTQRAHVQRFTPGGVDDYHNAKPGAWNEHITGLPIFLYGSTEREVISEQTTAVVANLKAMVPRGADVTESDRLGGNGEPAIVDRRGEIIEPGPLGIETVLHKRTHLQLTLSRVTS